MAAFDASVISDIGGSGPDVTGSIAKGLTLADLYDTNTLNKMKVGEEQQKQSDMTYAKQILSGKDLSKLEDQHAAVEQITKRSPQLGMELARSFSGANQDKNAETMQQIQLLNAKNDIVGSAVYQLKAKHDALLAQNPKATEQQIHDAMQQDVINTLTSLSQQKLPNGQPLLDANDKANIKRDFGNGYNVAAVDAMVVRSQQAKEAIAQHLKQAADQRAERKEEDTEKRTEAMIKANERRLDQGDRRLSMSEQAAKTKAAAAEGGKLGDDDIEFMAEQYLAGDKSILTGLGRGAQGPQNIIAVRHAIAKEAKAQGLNGQDVAAKLAEYQGYVSEQRSVGTQQANTEMASSEAQQMIANARGASDDTAVSRAHALGWNKIEQWGEKQNQDPKLASLAAATTAVINTWSRAINPKGVATVADKEHGYELLNAAQDKATYDAVLDRFQQETEASLAAPASAKQRLHDAFIGNKTPSAAAAPDANSLQPTPGRGAPAAGGAAAMPASTILRFDAQGNPIS